MKLDLNCIRDTLLTLESWLTLNEDLEFVCLDLDDLCKSSDMLKYSKSSYEQLHNNSLASITIFLIFNYKIFSVLLVFTTSKHL